MASEQELQEKKDRHDKLKKRVEENNKLITQKKLLTRRAIEHHQEEAILRDMLEIDFE